MIREQTNLLEPLMRTFNFTPDEAAANRGGVLTERQVALINQYRRAGRGSGWANATLLVGSLMIIALIAIVGIGGQQLLSNPPVLTTMVVFVSAIMSGLCAVLFIGYLRTSDVRSGKISVVDGAAELIDWEVLGAFTPQLLKVGSVGFPVGFIEHRAATQQAIRYALDQVGTCRAYYVRNVRFPILLSMEPLDTLPDR